jgi:hypothetical protein
VIMQRYRFLPSSFLRGAAVLAAVLCFAGCISPEIVSLDKIEKGKLYVVGRIVFDNFQIEPEMLPEGKKTCYVIFTRREGDYLGMGQGFPESVVLTTWGRYFVHALTAGGSKTNVHRVASVALQFQKDVSPYARFVGDNFELLFDLSFEGGADVSCVYIGDIVFTLRNNDMFVEVHDCYEEAREYFRTVIKPDATADEVVLEKRLLTGGDFVELRRTSSNGGRMRYYPTF